MWERPDFDVAEMQKLIDEGCVAGYEDFFGRLQSSTVVMWGINAMGFVDGIRIDAMKGEDGTRILMVDFAEVKGLHSSLARKGKVFCTEGISLNRLRNVCFVGTIDDMRKTLSEKP